MASHNTFWRRKRQKYRKFNLHDFIFLICLLPPFLLIKDYSLQPTCFRQRETIFGNEKKCFAILYILCRIAIDRREIFVLEEEETTRSKLLTVFELFLCRHFLLISNHLFRLKFDYKLLLTITMASTRSGKS